MKTFAGDIEVSAIVTVICAPEDQSETCKGAVYLKIDGEDVKIEKPQEYPSSNAAITGLLDFIVNDDPRYSAERYVKNQDTPAGGRLDPSSKISSSDGSTIIPVPVSFKGHVDEWLEGTKDATEDESVAG